MQSNELKNLVVGTLEETKGKDITVLDVSDKTDVTDAMIIVSGTSSRHVKSLADNLVKTCKEAGVMPLGVEGEEQAEWVLVDLGDVVVHLMMPSARQFYDLERLWEASVEQVEAAFEEK
ncbi:ribosome silencing factor [Parendozoicomonas sp. Alg238-R29]|uniref:ribosome silencing factor n=1 Tax=Parendozoicomonas sp. Alg238-R29 TaxID=2993446 RepID=UPI00248E23E2|nr:ribosome silencing factor [Parendozoicomonas sp. Alg238-R29]